MEDRVVPEGCAGMRLDRALSALFGGSRASLQRVLAGGRVRVNGIVQKKSYGVEKGDLLSVQFPQPEPLRVVPEAMEFRILYEDPFLFVINKPPGMVVHPAPGNKSGTFVNGFVAYCSELACIDPVRPGLIHRLDKDTSGVLMAAKDPRTLEAMSRLFQDRLVEKEYLAIVHGRFEGRRLVTSPIGRDPKNRQRMAVVEGGKDSETEFFSLEAKDSVSLVRAVPYTGRTHQIRVHLRSLGHPVIGDLLYGPASQSAAPRQMLHCASIAFEHPISKKPCVICAPPPEDMRGWGFHYIAEAAQGGI